MGAFLWVNATQPCPTCGEDMGRGQSKDFGAVDRHAGDTVAPESVDQITWLCHVPGCNTWLELTRDNATVFWQVHVDRITPAEVQAHEALQGELDTEPLPDTGGDRPVSRVLFTAATAMPAEGVRVGFVTCKRCGAAVLLDPRDTIDALAIHERWHQAIDREWGA